MIHKRQSNQTGIISPELVTPEYMGQLYIDTQNNKMYTAKSLTQGDWVKLGTSDGFQSWNNINKIEHPTGDVIGYNTEANRIEFYIKATDQWLYLWSEFIAITEIPTSPYFSENFETGWFTQNLFNQLFIEDFESNWFTNNIFNQIFTETFEGGF